MYIAILIESDGDALILSPSSWIFPKRSVVQQAVNLKLVGEWKPLAATRLGDIGFVRIKGIKRCATVL